MLVEILLILGKGVLWWAIPLGFALRELWLLKHERRSNTRESPIPQRRKML